MTAVVNQEMTADRDDAIQRLEEQFCSLRDSNAKLTQVVELLSQQMAELLGRSKTTAEGSGRVPPATAETGTRRVQAEQFRSPSSIFDFNCGKTEVTVITRISHPTMAAGADEVIRRLVEELKMLWVQRNAKFSHMTELFTQTFDEIKKQGNPSEPTKFTQLMEPRVAREPTDFLPISKEIVIGGNASMTVESPSVEIGKVRVPKMKLSNLVFGDESGESPMNMHSYLSVEWHFDSWSKIQSDCLKKSLYGGFVRYTKGSGSVLLRENQFLHFLGFLWMDSLPDQECLEDSKPKVKMKFSFNIFLNSVIGGVVLVATRVKIIRFVWVSFVGVFWSIYKTSFVCSMRKNSQMNSRGRAANCAQLDILNMASFVLKEVGFEVEIIQIHREDLLKSKTILFEDHKSCIGALEAKIRVKMSDNAIICDHCSNILDWLSQMGKRKLDMVFGMAVSNTSMKITTPLVWISQYTQRRRLRLLLGFGMAGPPLFYEFLIMYREAFATNSLTVSYLEIRRQASRVLMAGEVDNKSNIGATGAIGETKTIGSFSKAIVGIIKSWQEAEVVWTLTDHFACSGINSTELASDGLWLWDLTDGQLIRYSCHRSCVRVKDVDSLPSSTARMVSARKEILAIRRVWWNIP